MFIIGLLVLVLLSSPVLAAPSAPTPDQLDYQDARAQREIESLAPYAPSLRREPLPEPQAEQPSSSVLHVWPGPRRPAAVQPKRKPTALMPRPTSGLVPVTLELEVTNPKEYRDAVAEVSKTAGFRMDPSVAPRFRDFWRRTRVSVRGWMKAARFTDAVGLNRLRRLEVGPSPESSSAPSQDPSTELLIGLRSPQSLPVDEFLGASLERLGRQTGFEVRRVVGRRTLNGSRVPVVIVRGRVPVRNIGRVLADPSVVKVSPFQVGFGGLLSSFAGAPAEAGALAWACERPALVLTAFLLVLCAGSLARPKRPSKRPSGKRSGLFV